MVSFDTLGVQGPALPGPWVRYRDAYAVLQYLCTLSDHREGVGISWPKAVLELGLTERQGECLLQYLLSLGLIEYHQGQRDAAITARGREYLDHECGRRRSVRPGATAHA